jgi:hypothetical protein
MPKKNIKDKKKDKKNKILKNFKNKIAIKIAIDNSKKTHKNLRKKADDQAKQQPFIFNSSLSTTPSQSYPLVLQNPYPFQQNPYQNPYANAYVPQQANHLGKKPNKNNDPSKSIYLQEDDEISSITEPIYKYKPIYIEEEGDEISSITQPKLNESLRRNLERNLRTPAEKDLAKDILRQKIVDISGNPPPSDIINNETKMKQYLSSLKKNQKKPTKMI